MMDLCEMPRWLLLKQTLNNLSLKEFIDGYRSDPKAICLDVRTGEEFRMGHLSDATNIDYLSYDLVDILEMLDAQKNYYVYCRTSRRSLRVCVLLSNMGFEKIYNLENGVKDCITELMIL